jgi:hypothetical protein
VARDLGATSETASKGARWLASSPHHTRGRYLGIRGPAEKEGPVRACVAALPRWSGWLYAHQTLWLDPGPDWDEEKVAEFLAMCASTWCARHPATATQVGARREAPVILTVDAAAMHAAGHAFY